MDKEEYARKEADKFNGYLKLFRYFYSEDEGMVLDNDLPQEDSIENPFDTLQQLKEDSVK